MEAILKNGVKTYFGVSMSKKNEEHQARRQQMGIFLSGTDLDRYKQKLIDERNFFIKDVLDKKILNDFGIEVFKKKFLNIKSFRVTVDQVFKGGKVLSKSEKISFNLNPKKKYYKEFIDCLNLEKINDLCPKELINKIIVESSHKASHKESIDRFIDMGVEEMKVECICGEISKKIKINDNFDYPGITCKNRYCICDLSPIIHDTDDLDRLICH